MNNYKKIILIAGNAQAGKDTLGKMIKNTLVNKKNIKNCKILHFADKLKYLSYNILKNYDKNIELNDFYHNKDTHSDLLNDNYRSFLQNTGASCRNILDKNIWIDTLNISSGFNIIPDHRYVNEKTRLKELYKDYDILTIKVVRDLKNNINYSHESELGIDDYDYIYCNYSSIDDMKKWVENSIINMILK